MDKLEAISFLQGKINCMCKCNEFDWRIHFNQNDCEHCDCLYEQGNFAQFKEALCMARDSLFESAYADAASGKWVPGGGFDEFSR